MNYLKEILAFENWTEYNFQINQIFAYGTH